MSREGMAVAGRPILVSVESLKKHFPITRGVIWSRQVGAVKAVDGLTFDIYQGETLGLVGESGCGKSTAGRVILQLQRPTAGRVLFQGLDLTLVDDNAMRRLRPQMQMIFQDSYATLNPRHSVGKIVGEPLLIHGAPEGETISERVAELLSLVGLNSQHARRFPHEFSGGQRQRINIARALALNPRFVVCDEPISALDVSIQAQVVNLLQDLQEKLGLTYLFIAHDLSMVRHISSRVAVMYLGKIMELASRDDLFNNPLHPYTQSLMSAVPVPNPKLERERQRIILRGDVPSPAHPPPGCVFNSRCPLAQQICFDVVPEYREVRPNHFAACHLIDSETGSQVVSEVIPVADA
jgi:oligopeptide transport system ATP-binding protein